MAGSRRASRFGFWPSPLTAASVAEASVKRTDLQVHRGSIFVSERRPEEGGRSVIVRHRVDANPADQAHDVVSHQRNVRSTAHEYGGACYRVFDDAEGNTRIVFVDHGTRSLVIAPITGDGPSEEECSLIHAPDSAFADLRFDSTRQRLVCARETHETGKPEPSAAIVAIDLNQANPPTPGIEPDESAAPQVLVDARELGLDFLVSPRISPDGHWLAFIGWRHPNMPWDNSELWLARLDGQGRARAHRKVFGGDDVSVFQPEFSPDGVLHCVADATGWWNLFRLEGQLDGQLTARNLTPIGAEFGLPQWVFGMSTYQVPRPDLAIAICCARGTWKCLALDPTRPDPPLLEVPLDVEHRGTDDPSDSTTKDQLSFLDSIAADNRRVALLAAGPRTLPLMASWKLDGLVEAPLTIDAQQFEQLPAESISVGRTISFPSPHSNATIGTADPNGSRVAHAFYYPPTNRDAEVDSGLAPPLIVKSHGGPTAATSNALDPAVQFWTSRGFAVIDVNYAGSTGYGRAYRRLLDGAWGIHDVEDCAAAALFAVEQGLAHQKQLIIRGGSAGGYTTLAALAFTEVFAGGASLYGIGDLEALARDTHKFESRYLDGLVGLYPEDREVYRQRSPLRSADRLSCPVIFFQGTEDKVVPPNQSEAMHAALKAKGVPTDYVAFDGEGHGFRRAENIIRALEEELRFYREHVL